MDEIKAKPKKKNAGAVIVKATRLFKSTRFVCLPPDLGLTAEEYQALCGGGTMDAGKNYDKRYFEEVK